MYIVSKNKSGNHPSCFPSMFWRICCFVVSFTNSGMLNIYCSSAALTLICTNGKSRDWSYEDTHEASCMSFCVRSSLLSSLQPKKKKLLLFYYFSIWFLWLLDGREGRRWSSFKDWRKEFQTNIAGFEEMELNIAQILEKKECFIQQVAK